MTQGLASLGPKVPPSPDAIPCIEQVRLPMPRGPSDESFDAAPGRRVGGSAVGDHRRPVTEPDSLRESMDLKGQVMFGGSPVEHLERLRSCPSQCF